MSEPENIFKYPTDSAPEWTIPDVQTFYYDIVKKCELEIFQLKASLKLSQELNASYEKIIENLRIEAKQDSRWRKELQRKNLNDEIIDAKEQLKKDLITVFNEGMRTECGAEDDEKLDEIKLRYGIKDWYDYE